MIGPPEVAFRGNVFPKNGVISYKNRNYDQIFIIICTAKISTIQSANKHGDKPTNMVGIQDNLSRKICFKYNLPKRNFLLGQLL